MINNITKVIQERKNELTSLLKKEDDLTPEIRHQIYGAINEIDIFLRTLNYYRDLEIKNEIKELKLVQPEKKQKPLFNFFKRKNVADKKLKQNQPNEEK